MGFSAAEIFLETLLFTLRWTPLVGTNQPSHLLSKVCSLKEGAEFIPYYKHKNPDPAEEKALTLDPLFMLKVSFSAA